MLKWPCDIGQRDIHIDSTSICQRWFINKIQRWNNADFWLTQKTILLLYYDTWKIEIFVLTLKGNHISTSKQCQFINVKSMLKSDVETALILG